MDAGTSVWAFVPFLFLLFISWLPLKLVFWNYPSVDGYLGRIVICVLPLIFLATDNGKVKYWLRSVVFALAVGLITSWASVISIFISPFGEANNINYYVARTFHYTMGPIINWKVKSVGLENLRTVGPKVVVGNHQSMVDLYYLGEVMSKGSRMMVKKELFWAPFLGAYLYMSNAIFIDRKNRSDSLRAFADAAEEMKKSKTSVFIFPEGTRSNFDGPLLLPFKKGAFHLAVQAQVPIIPTVCENYYSLFRNKDHVFEGGEIQVRVLPAISTKGVTSSHEDIEALVEKTRKVMLDALVELSENRKAMQLGANNTGPAR